MRLGWYIAFGIGLVAVALPLGCKKHKDPITPPQGTANIGTGMPPPGPAPTTAPTQTAPVPTATAAPTGPALDPTTMQQLVAQIDAQATTQAARMQPVGEAFGAQLAAGGQAESPQFTIEFGKCYAVVAQGGLGVTEVDVQLMAKPLVPIPAMPSSLLAVDNTTGAAAAISPCWSNPWPVGFPATLVVVARGGAGPVAARVYVK